MSEESRGHTPQETYSANRNLVLSIATAIVAIIAAVGMYWANSHELILLGAILGVFVLLNGTASVILFKNRHVEGGPFYD